MLSFLVAPEACKIEAEKGRILIIDVPVSFLSSFLPPFMHYQQEARLN